jgi:hypothetical protein
MARRNNTSEGTSRKRLAQVIVCEGCCCGRVDKGHPAVPREWLKTEWRKRLLPGKVHLTFSGCVGPCDISNVVMVVTEQQTVWLGGLDRQSHFADLADWASACARAGAAVPLPRALEHLRFDRFTDSRLIREEVA